MLRPYRVLDLTDERADLCGFVLAGLGADVIKVEPPGGSTARHAPAAPGAEGWRFAALNRGKRSVVLDLETQTDRERFLRLVASADFLIENHAPGALDALGLGHDVLRAVRPDLVQVAITPFGQDGPYANHLATDLTLAAMGGSMALNGDPDRRPVRITVPQNWHHAAAEAVVGALVAHRLRQNTGEGQYVDVSAQAAVFWTGLNAMTAHAIQGRDIERFGTVLQLATLVTPLVYPCADGEVVLLSSAATMLALVPWLIECGVIDRAWAEAEDWPTYEQRMLTNSGLVHSVEAVREKIQTFTLMHSKQTLFEGGIARGVTIAPVNTTADVLDLEQLRVRDFWRPLTLPDGRVLRAAGAFVRASETPVTWSRPAPALGEHNRELLDEQPAQPARPLPRVPRSERRLPFEGVKFADFSWIGVGPITAKSFADNGATVIRIESEEPVDRLRLVGPFKDNIPGINRCQFFGAFNASKRSLQLNLKHPDGIAIAKRLIAWADICLDSFAAGKMASLGLSYEAARAINPRIIMATTCLLGQTGPAAKLAGYGYHAAAVSGFYEVTGWNDRAPAGPFNAYTDTIAPRFLAASLMAALDHRDRTGVGQFIDQAQMESSLHFLSPELLETQLTGSSPRRAGNLAPDAAPHDAYPCAGLDEWCAIAVTTDVQWRALRTFLGNPAELTDARFDGLAGRLAARDHIDAVIARHTQSQDAEALMLALQGVGVPAGMVKRSSDHMRDPQLAHRRFFRRHAHPEMGEVDYEGHPYRIRGHDNGPIGPAPCLGEHTFEVLKDILGMDDEEIGRVVSNGAIS